MIPWAKNSFYLVYPSWAKLCVSWSDLPLLFAAPLESGKLNQRMDWAKLGYVSGQNCYEFIDGPYGNGIIKGIGSEDSKYLWKAALWAEASASLPPGIPRHNAPDYRVACIEEKERAEHALGFEKKAKTF